MAARAAKAAENNNLCESYKIVRLLSGKCASHRSKSVADSDGNILLEDADIKARWQEHFASVFNAPVCQLCHLHLPCPSPNTANRNQQKYSIEQVEEQVDKLGRNKGIDLDGIEAELIQASGPIYIRALHGFVNASARLRYVPMAWRG
eukprot:3828854-Karenia_brevis.AAC.1